jgi:hypothetical protein
MNGYHWGAIVLFLLIGYALGVWMPGPGLKVRASLGM